MKVFFFYLLLNICRIAILLNTVFNFWRLKTLVLWQIIVQNLPIFVYLFCAKVSTINSRKTSITLERFVIESCPTPLWIAFLMLYRLAYKIRSYFNQLIFGLKWLNQENIRFEENFKLLYHYMFAVDRNL